MAKRYSPAMQILALAGAVLLVDAGSRTAQAETIEVLIELARNDASQDVVALSGSDLVAILEAATEAERAELLALLPSGDLDALVAALVGGGAAPSLIASVVVASIPLDDAGGERFCRVVEQNAPPVALPAISAALVEELGRVVSVSGDVNPALIEEITNCAIALDPRPGTIDAIIAVANAATATNGPEAIGRALALIAETAAPELASAIETAVAISGNDRLATAFSAAAGVPPVADVPVQPPVPPAPPVPVIPAAAIGGGGATVGGDDASRTGEDFIPFAGGSGGDGLSGTGGGVTRSTDSGSGPVVSPQ